MRVSPRAGAAAAPPGAHPRLVPSLRFPPSPTEIALHELVEIAVEHRRHVARLDLRAQVLDHLIWLHDVRPDLTAPADLCLLTGDAVELRLTLLFDLRGDHRAQTVHRLLAVLQLAALLLRR